VATLFGQALKREAYMRDQEQLSTQIIEGMEQARREASGLRLVLEDITRRAILGHMKLTNGLYPGEKEKKKESANKQSSKSKSEADSMVSKIS